MWLFNSLANVIRGTGNMAMPAIVTCAGVVVLIPLSPCLIFGWGPFPRLGIAGGAVAVLTLLRDRQRRAGGLSAIGAQRHSAELCRHAAAWALFRDILRVGAVAALITVQTNLTIAIATGLVGVFGPAAIAGYGTGSRLEYLLIPLVFGLGGPLVAMVGTNIGAGRRERALRVAWIGAAIAAGLARPSGFPLPPRRARGCRCLTLTRRCSTPARAICTRSARSMAFSASAWRSISPRRARGGCCGR